MSSQLVTRLGNLVARRFNAHRVVARQLPTEWETAPAKLETIYAREQPKIALHFGVSPNADGFVIETIARNHQCKREDACGALPRALHVRDGAADRVPVTVPAREIVRRLKALGLPAVLSEDAGLYVCNALLYHSLALSQDHDSETQVGFVHIPTEISSGLPAPASDGSQQGLDWEAALLGGLEIVRTCMGRPPSRRR